MPLPHEPVSYRWIRIDGVRMIEPIDWPWNETRDESIEIGDVVEITLANGQRIIVRAKS